MRLRTKILSYTLPLILIPFLLMALAVYYFVIRENQTRIEEEKRQSLNEVIVLLGQEVDSARKDINLLSNVPAIAEYLGQPTATGDITKDEDQARSVLEIFFKQNPYYLEVSLTDKLGKERIKFSKLTKPQDMADLKGESYFLRTLITGSVQTPVVEVKPNKYATIFTRSINRQGEFLGVIILSLNTEIFERSMRPLLRRNLETFLFDDRGVILASVLTAREDSGIKTTDLANDASELLSDSSFGEMRKEIERGREKYVLSFMPSESFPQVGTFEQPKGANWFLGIVEPKAATSVPFAFQAIFFSILFSAIGAVLWAATKAANRVTIPLEKVSAATTKIARGETNLDLEVKTGDEVEDLANAVGKMNSELKSYQKQIVQTAKLATMGEMTSEISHEIQNRISGISLWLQHLDSEIEIDDSKREYIDEMKLGLSGFMSMLRDLKQYYKKPTLNLGECEPNSIVEEVLPYVKEKLAEKNINVVTEFSDSLPTFVCDREKLTGVLLNLLVNAIDSVDENGEIMLRTGEKLEACEVFFEVDDNGRGIEKENLSRIFYPFFSTKSGGSGLGLSISSNIIAAHKGRIEVNSEVGEGTSFKVTLPATQINHGKNSRS